MEMLRVFGAPMLVIIAHVISIVLSRLGASYIRKDINFAKGRVFQL